MWGEQEKKEKYAVSLLNLTSKPMRVHGGGDIKLKINYVFHHIKH